MATNPFFTQGTRNEQLLYEDIVLEALKIYGQDVYYLPRTLINENKILAEDIPSQFGSAHKIEMYIENTEGFDGEGDLFTKFGVEIRDAATFIVSRRRWTSAVGRHDNLSNVRPFEGDLIYLPLTNKLFEIMHVEHEQPFYQLSNLSVYKLRAELFEYNEDVSIFMDKSNLCITRAGATTLAELVFLTLPHVAIPLPSSKDNHQFENAYFYKKNDCCWLIEQMYFKEKIGEVLEAIFEKKSDYLKKKENLKKLNYQNTWIGVNQKILGAIDEN